MATFDMLCSRVQFNPWFNLNLAPPGAVSAEQLVVGCELVPRPPLLPLPVAVLGHRRVLHEGHVAAALMTF